MILDLFPPVRMEEFYRYKNVTTNMSMMLSPSDANSNYTTYGNEVYYHKTYVYDMSYRARTILSMPQNVMAMILGVIAITLNILSILAISKLCHSQLTSHFRLILNLAISDVLIGVSLILFIFINAFVEQTPPGDDSIPDHKRLISRCLYCFSKALNSTGFAITLLNLMGMAIDHYVAIMRPLHYGVMLSRERSMGMIAILWIVAILFGFSDFFSAYPKYSLFKEHFNFCEFIYLTKYNEEYTLFVVALLCLISMLFIYIKIYMEVRKHQARTPQVSQDMVRSKKAVITTLLILGTFIVCWMPMYVFSVVCVILVSVNRELIQQNMEVLYTVDMYLFVLLLVNAIADPIIYAIRVKEVQFGYRRLCCRRKMLRRRRSNASYEASQFTTFVDMPRKASRVSNTDIFSKYGGHQSHIPMLRPPEISVISPE